jgi:hypothetical protein
MIRFITAAAILALASPAMAQTATGTGVGVSESNSAAGALAVNRGNGNSSSSLTVLNPANTNATVNSTVSGTTTQNIVSSGTTTSNVNQRVSGSQTIKTNPSLATQLTAAGLETCLGSASGMISLAGFGLGGGSTMTDEGCQARLDARTLASFGLKAAAVARLCQRPDIYASMPDVCERYRPVVVASAGGPGVIMSTSAGSVEPIEVIEGKTGRTRLCDTYDAARFRCLAWNGAPKIKVTARLPKPHPIASAPGVAAINAATAAPQKEVIP